MLASKIEIGGVYEWVPDTKTRSTPVPRVPVRIEKITAGRPAWIEFVVVEREGVDYAPNPARFSPKLTAIDSRGGCFASNIIRSWPGELLPSEQTAQRAQDERARDERGSAQEALAKHEGVSPAAMMLGLDRTQV